METITKSAQQTQEFGQKFGSSLKGGEILALSGDLGSGKTTFLQGLAKGLGIKGQIISPTFILMRSYGINHYPLFINHHSSTINHFYHVDLYRLEGDLGDELNSLGITDLWGKKGNIFAIEWAERAKDYIPKNAIWIKFETLGETTRKITSKNI